MDDSSKRQETSNDEVVTNEFMLHGTDIPKFQETSNEVIAANDFEDAMYMLQGTDSPEFQETQKLRQQQEVQAEAAAAYMDIDKIRWQICEYIYIDCVHIYITIPCTNRWST